MTFKIGHIRSLIPSLHVLQQLIHTADYDSFCISETWLGSNIDNNAIQIDGYNLYRQDRRCMGGGLCIYIKDTFLCSNINGIDDRYRSRQDPEDAFSEEGEVNHVEKRITLEEDYLLKTNKFKQKPHTSLERETYESLETEDLENILEGLRLEQGQEEKENIVRAVLTAAACSICEDHGVHNHVKHAA
nr:unnamed protein product [Callosobruchus analis]